MKPFFLASRFRQILPLWAIVLFFAFRFVSLNSLPIFNDEAIYLHWGQAITNDASNWKLPLILDGKQPGYFVILGIAELLPLDPLFVGRAVSIFFGFVTFLVTIVIAERFFSCTKSAKTFLIILFCCVPFVVFFDRMSLTESPVTACSMVALFFFLKIRERPQYTASFLLGTTLLIGWLMKSTMLVVIFPMIVIAVKDIVNKKDRNYERLSFYAIALSVFGCVALTFFLSPYFQLIHAKEATRMLSLNDVLHFPFALWVGNFSKVVSWFFLYLTPGVFLAVVIGTVKNWRQKEHDILWICWMVPVLVEVFLIPGLTSRYVSFVAPMMLLTAALGLDYLKSRFWQADFLISGLAFFAGVVLIISPLIFYDYAKILPLAGADFSQYVTGWTSGYGVNEAARWLGSQAQTQPRIVVLLRADSGNPESAMLVYLQHFPKVQFFAIQTFFAPENATQKQEILAQHIPVYFVSRGEQFAGLEKILQPIAKFPKPLDEEFVGVYKVQL